MRYLFGFLCVCALGVVPLGGCGDTDGGTGGEVRLYVFTLIDPLGLEDVEVCEAATDNCAMSDSLGNARLEVPADQEVMFTFKKEGYGKWVMADVSDETAEFLATRRMHTDDQLEAVAAQLGIEYPWTSPIVGLVKYPSETEGLTFAAVGSSVGEVGDSFYYDSTAEEYSTDLNAATAVEENWLLPLGAGGFTDVTVGEQTFELGGTAFPGQNRMCSDDMRFT